MSDIIRRLEECAANSVEDIDDSMHDCGMTVAEAKEVFAIVSALPVTADGVPVVPGQNRIYKCVNGEIMLADIGIHKRACLMGRAIGISYLISECYSTRELAEGHTKRAEAATAEAAKEKNDG